MRKIFVIMVLALLWSLSARASDITSDTVLDINTSQGIAKIHIRYVPSDDESHDFIVKVVDALTQTPIQEDITDSYVELDMQPNGRGLVRLKDNVSNRVWGPTEVDEEGKAVFTGLTLGHRHTLDVASSSYGYIGAYRIYPREEQELADIEALVEFDVLNRLDVTHDGKVNVSDVNVVVSTILSRKYIMLHDVNGDGEISVTDINLIVSDILNPK